MRPCFAVLSLLIFLFSGCETVGDSVDPKPDPILELTDGFCLVEKDRVLLNHSQIDYYDYSAHLIYLKPGVSLPSTNSDVEGMTVYAGGEAIYSATARPGSLPKKPALPIIWTDPIFYTDNVWALAWVPDYEERMAVKDPRTDSRIEDALRKYGQFREGLQGELLSVRYESAQEVEVKIRLFNEDQVNYYYLDPDRMGKSLFHFFTSGLSLWNEEQHWEYSHLEEVTDPDDLDSWDPAWFSVLEQGTSDTLTILYEQFSSVPYGTYAALFTFPGLTFQAQWEDLEQANGRLWLGELHLDIEMVVDPWY